VADTVSTRPHRCPLWKELPIDLQTTFQHLSWQMRRHWRRQSQCLVNAHPQIQYTIQLRSTSYLFHIFKRTSHLRGQFRQDSRILQEIKERRAQRNARRVRTC